MWLKFIDAPKRSETGSSISSINGSPVSRKSRSTAGRAFLLAGGGDRSRMPSSEQTKRKPGKSSPASSRLKSKASARELHPKQNASLQESPPSDRKNHPDCNRHRRACADCFRSQSVASALELRSGATPAKQDHINKGEKASERSVTFSFDPTTPSSVTGRNDLTRSFRDDEGRYGGVVPRRSGKLAAGNASPN